MLLLVTGSKNDHRTRVFAENLKRLRLAENWSQTELARAMKERGFSFHQQTIQRIEDQERPVRLDEAYALAEIVHASVDQMSWSQDSLLKQAVDELVLGAATVSTAMLRSSDQWFLRCDALVADLTRTLETDPDAPRTEIGIELLARVVTAVEEANDMLEKSVAAEFLVSLGESSDVGASSESRAEVTQAEQAVRSLIEHRKSTNKYANMTFPDLCELYLSSSR
jgi:transcriptional regulator with XRE-family HTH domain